MESQSTSHTLHADEFIGLLRQPGEKQVSTEGGISF